MSLGFRKLVRRRPCAMALGAITLLGLWLRLHGIGAQSFWYDEAWSAWASRPAIADVLVTVRQDVNPPLYFLLLHFWMRLTASEGGIRLLSALCSVLNIPVIYLLGRRIAGQRLALLAALILAVSPFHVMYAQEARMYALLSLLVSLSLYFLARLLDDPRAADALLGRGLVQWWRSVRVAAAAESGDPASCRKSQQAGVGSSLGLPPSPRTALATDLSWAGFMGSTAAAMLTHNTAMFLPLGLNYYVLGRYLVHRIAAHRAPLGAHEPGQQPVLGPLSGRFIANWLVAQLGVFLLFSPWLPSFVAQSVRVDELFWMLPPTLKTVYDAWWKLSSAWAPQAGAYSLLTPLLFAGLAILGLVQLRRQPRWLALLVVLGLAPIAGELVVSLRRPIFSDRTLIWASIPYYLLLAAGLLQLRRRALIAAGLSALMVINGLSLAGYYSNYQKQHWREITAYVCERTGAQDLVILGAAYDVQPAFDYYGQRCRTRLDEQWMQATAENVASLPRLTAGRPRVWLIYLDGDWADPKGLLTGALKEEFRQVGDEQFRELRVLEFVRE